MSEVFKKRYVLPAQLVQPSFTNYSARHYSYECKATAQERPYVSRPSRTQQLRNPKLVPKLNDDTPNSLVKRKGAADEELARKEAERERNRAMGERGDESDEAPRRARSPSVDSVSTVSTNSRSGSASPPRHPSDRQGSSDDEEAGEITEAVPRRHRSRSRSPHRRRDGRREQPIASPKGSDRRHRDKGHRRRSRSPRERGERDDRQRVHMDHRGPRREREDAAPKSEPKERSLSPFSQRLALTRAMQR